MPNTVPLVLSGTQHGSYTSFNRLNADFSIQFITLTIRHLKTKRPTSKVLCDMFICDAK